MNKFEVRIFNSAKTGRKCYAVVAHLGWRDTYLTFDPHTVADLLNVSMTELAEKPEGFYPIN